MSLSSLYDGVGFGDSKEKENMGLDASQIAGWSDNLMFMKTQLQIKKAAKGGGGGIRGSKSLTTSGPGTVTLSNITGTAEKQVVLVDEYNPLRPNDYATFKERHREKEEREPDRQDREREKDRERRDRDRDRERSDDRKSRDKDDREKRRDRDRDDRDKDKERERRRKREAEDRSRDRGRAAIAPPPSLLETTPINPDLIQKKDGAGTGGFQTGNLVANQIMAKYGWKEGQGLGREEQGLSTCLQVEKTGKRAGKIINRDVEKEKQKHVVPSRYDNMPNMMEGEGDDDSITERMKNPSKVVLLKNMVGPGEVDDDLQPEIEEECQMKYGDINKVLIFEIPKAPEDEAVRIFVEFKRMESAIKALVDLNGRFFGGRTVTAMFYNLDKFRRLDLAS